MHAVAVKRSSGLEGEGTRFLAAGERDKRVISAPLNVWRVASPQCVGCRSALILTGDPTCRHCLTRKGEYVLHATPFAVLSILQLSPSSPSLPATHH